jgi:hypothetical protein
MTPWGCTPATDFAGGVLFGINNDMYGFLESYCAFNMLEAYLNISMKRLIIRIMIFL